MCKKIKIYYSGNIYNLGIHEYIKNAKEIISILSFDISKRLRIPWKIEPVYAKEIPEWVDEKYIQEYIVETDLENISNSDMLIVDLSAYQDNMIFTGSVVENYYASTVCNIPCYGFKRDELKFVPQAGSAWIKYFLTNKYNLCENLTILQEMIFSHIFSKITNKEI